MKSSHPKRYPPRLPNPIDIHVGGRLRLRRILLDLSQTRLGDAVGITSQQVQKYERGANRMGSSRLWQFAELLDVPITYFFDNMPDEIATPENAMGTRSQGPIEDQGGGLMARKEVQRLVRYFCRIDDPRVRNEIISFVKDAGGTHAADGSDDD